MSHDPKNNPYSQAAGAYGQQAKETPDQRELESQLLLKAANEIKTLHDRWDEATPEDIDNILTYNRKLWTVFFDSAIENPDDRPKALRENIISLCNFIFKRSINIMAEPAKEKLLVLIDINREIAAGLAESAQNQAATETSENTEGTSEQSDGDNAASTADQNFTPTSI